MRILMVNNSHSVIGGADRVYFNTGKLLLENGHVVAHFSTVQPNNEPSSYSDYFPHVVKNREAGFAEKFVSAGSYIFNRKAYQNLSKLLVDFKPDIAHLHLYSGGLSVAVIKALHDHRIPMVQTVHDYRLLCPANAFLDAKSEICEKCRNQIFLHCAIKRCVDGNVFFSTMVALESYYKKYFVSPVNLMNHFIFVSCFSMNKHIEFDRQFLQKSSHLFNFTEIPNEITSNIRGEYFLYFGRLSLEKGINTLIRAANEKNIRLKIVGSGPLENNIRKLCDTSPFISFEGHKSGDDLREILFQASYIIVPSEWYENNPMTILEAYALGKPVIGARIGGIPEIINDGLTGFLFESRNQEDLGKILQKASSLSDTEYFEQSKNAREFALNNFAKQAHYEELMRIFSKVLKDVQ